MAGEIRAVSAVAHQRKNCSTKRGCCISHLSARCARHFPRKRGKLIYRYPKPSPLSRGRGTAQAVEGAQRRGCCTKFATSCNSPFLILSAAPAEAGGSPLCRTPAGDGESEHIFRGAKACFGVGESACGRGIDAACVCGRVLYGAVCIRTLCIQGRRWVFRPLRFTRRSVVAVSPACLAFVRAVTLSAGVG